MEGLNAHTFLPAKAVVLLYWNAGNSPEDALRATDEGISCSILACTM